MLKIKIQEKQRGKGKTYGWRKCSKSQALKMLTERSGKPLCGLPASCSIIPLWWNALCCLRLCSSSLSLGVSPLVTPEVPASLSPNNSQLCFNWAVIVSFRHRKCLDIAFWASVVYGTADPKPITKSNEFTTVCICSQQLLYLLST